MDYMEIDADKSVCLWSVLLIARKCSVHTRNNCSRYQNVKQANTLRGLDTLGRFFAIFFVKENFHHENTLI